MRRESRMEEERTARVRDRRTDALTAGMRETMTAMGDRARRYGARDREKARPTVIGRDRLVEKTMREDRAR